MNYSYNPPELVAVASNAVKDVCSRIRENSVGFEVGPNSHESGYTIFASLFQAKVAFSRLEANTTFQG